MKKQRAKLPKKLLDKKVDVTVQIGDDPPSKSVLVMLNLNDSLSNIREELKDTDIEMNVTLSFAKKTNQLAPISSQYEKEKKLNDVVETNNNGDNILYLVKNLKPNLEFLKDNCKLGYGRTIISNEIVVANKNAFIVKVEDCKLTPSKIGGYEKRSFEVNSFEDRTKNTELSFAGDINVHDLVKFRLSAERSNNTNSKYGTNSTYNYTYYNKASVKLGLKPTEEFINEVKKAIVPDNPIESRKNFKSITERFGRFIPKEVILGGIAYFEKVENSKESSEGVVAGVGVGVGGTFINANASHASEKSIRSTNYSKDECSKYIGGEKPDSEEGWIKSLEDYQNWDCIEFKKPVSIFQLLPEDLRNQIFLYVGKKILYLNIGTEDYKLNEIFDLKNKIPPYISDIIENENSDCSIFATVADAAESNNDDFNCQVLWQPGRKPRLMIHCIQQNTKKREYKLKIGLMVIGYDINFDFIHDSDFDVKLEVRKNDIKPSSMEERILLDSKYNENDENFCFGIPVLRSLNNKNKTTVIGHHFFKNNDNRIGTYTFSYCLEKDHYVKLPDFTFYTLILNDPNSNYCSFDCEDDCSDNKKTKYISIHSTREDTCGPIFRKQKLNRFKNFFKGRCTQVSCICDKKLKKSNRKYAFFDPFQGELISSYMKCVGQKVGDFFSGASIDVFNP